MGATASKKYAAKEVSVTPPKANKKYKSPTKAIKVSSHRIGNEVYEELYEDEEPLTVLGVGRIGDVHLCRRKSDWEDKYAVRKLTTANSSLEDMRRQIEVFEKLQKEVSCEWLITIASCCSTRGRARVFPRVFNVGGSRRSTVSEAPSTLRDRRREMITEGIPTPREPWRPPTESRASDSEVWRPFHVERRSARRVLPRLDARPRVPRGPRRLQAVRGRVPRRRPQVLQGRL